MIKFIRINKDGDPESVSFLSILNAHLIKILLQIITLGIISITLFYTIPLVTSYSLPFSAYLILNSLIMIMVRFITYGGHLQSLYYSLPYFLVLLISYSLL